MAGVGRHLLVAEGSGRSMRPVVLLTQGCGSMPRKDARREKVSVVAPTMALNGSTSSCTCARVV